MAIEPRAGLLELGAQLVAAALDAGADDAEVYLRQGSATRMTLQHDQLNESVGGQGGTALRVWCADRHALVTTDMLTAVPIAALARQAVALTRRQDLRRPALLPAGAAASPALDPAGAATPHDEKVAALLQVQDTLLRHPALTQAIINASYTDETFITALVNSRGLASAYQNQRHTLWFWLEGSGGHTMASASSRHWAGLQLDELTSQLIDQAVLLDQPASPAPNGPCEVLLSPLAAANLARSLGTLLLAENVLSDLRKLLEYIGRPIAAPAVTLVDDATLAGGLKSRPLDDEGTPTEATTLIERGTLRTLLHTISSAQRLGAAPNGKAVRGALWDQPYAAASNIALLAGDASPADLRRQIRRGLIVEGVMRPGRIQSATGKFTTVVHGWWVEDGVPIRRISGTPLSANIFKLLRGIRSCGNDLQRSSLADGAGAPSVLVDQMQVG